MLALACAVKSHDKISENALAELSAQKSLWEGADRYDFKYKGRDAILVAPQNPRSDRAWIMRPAFFGAPARQQCAWQTTSSILQKIRLN